MSHRATGRIVSWNDGSLWIMSTSAAQQTTPHAHHAVQVTLGLEGTFSIEVAGRSVRGPAVAIAPDTRHAFRLQGTAAHLFFEPEGRVGRSAVAALFPQGKVVPVTDPRAVELARALNVPRKLDDDALVQLGRAFVAGLAGEATPAAFTDHRVERMMAFAEQRLSGAVGLEATAAAVGLSPGRARHVFVQQTGLPFRVFLLWRRLHRALQLYAAGRSLTDAAHVAGFSDSAHLSRTFRRMFGVAAAELWLRNAATR